MKCLEEHQIQLLDLIAYSLFGGEESCTQITSEILQEANQQAVLSLINIDENISSKYYLLRAQILVNNVRRDCEHKEAHRLLEKARIPYVILKGSASAFYYPEPLARTMGDVDLLVSKSDFNNIDFVLRENGFEAEKTNEHECHVAYHRKKYGGLSIWEVHWQPNGIPKGEIGDKIRKYLMDIVDSAECHTSQGAYMLPTPFHHGLIMLLHVATHLINTGIGLRHLCDWAVFVDKFTDVEFCDLFEEKLKNVGLWKFAQLLTQLSMKYLGCAEKKWCGEADDDYLEEMMADIFAGGNFGIKDTNRINQAKLLSNAGKGSVDGTSFLKQFILTMNEKARMGMPVAVKFSVLLPVAWIYVGVRHIVRIKQKKRPNINVKDMVIGAADRKEIYRKFCLFEETE